MWLLLFNYTHCFLVSAIGCSKVTDHDLTVLYHLENIEELNVSALAITGHCLKNLQRLRYLNCFGSEIHDGPLCNVLVNCKDLRFINVGFCSNVTLATIKTAHKATLAKDNNILLRMIIDFGLISQLDIKISPLLELICPQFFSWFENRTVKYDFFFDIVNFLNDHYKTVTSVPTLNEYCMHGIFKFLSFAERTRMTIGNSLL